MNAWSGTDCYTNLIGTFGEKILAVDGEIDRRVLGSIVFQDKEKMVQLQSIVWPEIRRILSERIETYRTEGKTCVVLEAAVMIEAGWTDLVSSVWVIFVDPKIAVTRLMKRNNMSEHDAKLRLASQLSNDDRFPFAAFTIENSADEAQLEIAVTDAFEAATRSQTISI